MKVKPWIKYLIYICLILIMVFWGQHVFEVIKHNYQRIFEFNVFYINAMMIIFYGGIGVLMGLDHFLFEIKKEGKWKVNLPKIIFMGIPSVYFSFGIIICGINNEFIRKVIAYPIEILIFQDSKFIAIFQLILGYSIITSFYKDNKKG